MTKLSVLPHESLCPEGVQFDAKPGTSICDALLANGIAIEHACEKSCACTTCHVVVRRGGASLGEATESEEDMLDKAWGLEAQSRLSCQFYQLRQLRQSVQCLLSDQSDLSDLSFQ